MPCHLVNPFWELIPATDRAQIVSLRFDASGQGQWCANLLKTAPIDDQFAISFRHCPAPPSRPLALVTGAQTGYTDAAGAHHVSSAATTATVKAEAAQRMVVENIRYGNVRESWTIVLDGARLHWRIEQEWLADTQLVDAFLPAVMFSGSPNWGECTVFQLWSRAMAHDSFYGTTRILDCAMADTRRTATTKNQSLIAKLLSHARPSADWRVTGDGHLKKAELTNFCSYLGQSSFCEPNGSKRVNKGEVLVFNFTIESSAVPTGLAIDSKLRGPLAETAAINQRFYDEYINCGIMADTVNWRFGNSPSGYVALFCQYQYSEMVRFGVPAGAMTPDGWDGHHVLRHMMQAQSDHLKRDRTIGPCYIPAALDNLPAYLVAVRDLLALTGDRQLAAEIVPAAKIAFEEVAKTLDDGAGMIVANGHRCVDYWDWIARDGIVTSINVLTYAGLVAFAETARWCGDTATADSAQQRADTLAKQFNDQLWDEERGFYADWRDMGGQKHCYLYAGPQLHAIVAGLIPPERALRVVNAIRARRRELGPAWENCFSLQTNFYDARDASSVKGSESDWSSFFGRTMNGGCLASWNYYWIGALAKVGLVEEAVEAWQRVVQRFAQTGLIEGTNYWDYDGQPGRAKPVDDPQIAWEPALCDQGLVSVAPLRWLLGIHPRLDGLAVAPVLPPAARPATVRVMHLGRVETIRF